jgi:hypothetical protein
MLLGSQMEAFRRWGWCRGCRRRRPVRSASVELPFRPLSAGSIQARAGGLDGQVSPGLIRELGAQHVADLLRAPLLSQAGSDELAQLGVTGELRRLGSCPSGCGPPVRMVGQVGRAVGSVGVAAQLTADGRRRPAQVAGDGSNRPPQPAKIGDPARSCSERYRDEIAQVWACRPEDRFDDDHSCVRCGRGATVFRSCD